MSKTSSTKTRKSVTVTDKALGFKYTATGQGERVHNALKRMLSPVPGVSGMWYCYTYEHRFDEEYTLAHKKPKTTVQAMVWLSGDDNIKAVQPERQYEVGASLTRKEAQALKTLLSDTCLRDSISVSMQTVMLDALTALNLDLR